MKTQLSMMRSSVAVIFLAAVVAAQSKYEQAASLDIRIDSDHASIHQMEALPVELTFMNTGSEPIGVSREIFVGAWKDYGLRMKRPVKKGDAVTSELRLRAPKASVSRAWELLVPPRVGRD